MVYGTIIGKFQGKRLQKEQNCISVRRATSHNRQVLERFAFLDEASVYVIPENRVFSMEVYLSIVTEKQR